jgi:ADP-ribosylglycohydrolase
MAFSPIGIINACNPRQAALEALHVGSFIHNGPSGFCRDGAAAMSAAVAAAFADDATVDSVVSAATAYLMPESATVMIEGIRGALALAQKAGSYEKFRETYYERHLREIISDSRETVPAVIAVFKLAEGDARKAILWGANFGRDADTIATMVGGLVGAFHGASGLPSDWVGKVEANPEVDYQDLVPKLAALVRKRGAEAKSTAGAIEALG